MIAQACRDNLLTIARAYAKATGSTLSGVSKKFYGASGFLEEFRAGERSVSIDKFDEMVAAFSKAWPTGAEWPLMRAALIKRQKTKIPRRAGATEANHLDSHHESPRGRGPGVRADPA